MAASGGISIGDAVLTFLADTTQLDQAVARINSETSGKLQSSGTAVGKLKESFDSTGVSAAAAGQKSQAAGEQMESAFGSAGAAAHKGAAEVGLLGEATGITLPRHIRSFLAELPGVGAALSAAFAATAVLFLIDAVIQAAEKLDEFEKKPQAIEDAWRSVGDATATAGRTMEQSLNSAQEKIISLTQGPLAAMDYQIQHIGSDSEKVAGLVGSIGTALVTALQQQDTSKFNLLSFFIPNSREVSEDAKKFVGDLQSTLTQVGNQAGLVLLKSQLQGLDEEIKKTSTEFAQDSAKIGSALDVISGGGAQAAADVFKTRLDSLNRYKSSLLDLQNIIQKGIELDAANKEAAALEKQREAGALNAEQAKRDLDSQIALIQQREAVEHAAFVSGDKDAADFKVAQLNAIDATTAAHEKYLARLVSIYNASGDVVKAQAVAQELATAKTQDATKQLESLTAATEKYHTETLKILKDWQDIQNNAVTKNFEQAQQAVTRLTQEELKLADAQTKLSQAQIKTDFTAQEQAITNLANFGIISENQKAERLRILYQQEENDALNSLKDLLAKEKIAVDAAQGKLDAGRNNPFLTDAQVEDLQINLDRLKVAYTNTETEITNTTAAFEQKRLSVQRGAVAEAIALAQSEGRATLASDLLEKRTQLDLIDNEIRLARARGQNTDALQKERKAIQDTTNALVQEANRTKEVDRAIVELKTTVKQAASDELQAFATATAAAISSQESFGKALEAGTLRVIASLAQHWADYYFALAIAEAASGDWGAAAGHAAAAIAFEAVAGVASGIASNIENSAQASSSSGAGSSSASVGPPSAAQTPDQQPVSVINTPRLASGALLTKSTRIIAGDASSGGDSRKGEGIIPLDDDRAMDAIAGEIAKRIPAAGGDTHIHIKGDMIDYTKAMQKMSRHAKKGTGHMTVNNSFRFTRRG